MTDSPFTLDPVPPSLRKEKEEHKKRQNLKGTQTYRQRQYAKGNTVLSVYVPQNLLDEVATLQKRRGIRNLSAITEELIRAGIADIKKKEGVVSG